MPRILALPKYGTTAASMRQRLGQYLPYLERAGYRVEIIPFFENAYLERLNQGKKPKLRVVAGAYASRLAALRRVGDFDLIWLAYESFPYLPAFAETLIFRARRPVIVDFDDAIFHQYDCHDNRVVRRLLGNKLKPLLAGAAAFAGGNAYLADYASQFCSDVRILPTVVDTSLYRPAVARAEGAPVTIGWIGTPSTWRYVEPLVPLLRRLAARSDVQVKVVGAGHLETPPAGIDFIDWTEEREIAEIQSMDIGIMPLPDEPWARGKCGYKLIQYGACGLPAVGSPVGVNAEIINDGITGFTATTPDDFGVALERLIADPIMRSRFGAAARATVEERYSLAAHAPRLIKMLDDVMARQCAE